MKYEKITDQTIINKLYRPGKVQDQILNFHQSDDRVRKFIFEKGEYLDVRSSQSSFTACLKRMELGHVIKARILEVNLYLIKIL